jgi:hypothetical protein
METYSMRCNIDAIKWYDADGPYIHASIPVSKKYASDQGYDRHRGILDNMSEDEGYLYLVTNFSTQEVYTATFAEILGYKYAPRRYTDIRIQI